METFRVFNWTHGMWVMWSGEQWMLTDSTNATIFADRRSAESAKQGAEISFAMASLYEEEFEVIVSPSAELETLALESVQAHRRLRNQAMSIARGGKQPKQLWAKCARSHNRQLVRSLQTLKQVTR